MTILFDAGLRPLVGAVDQGGGWLYDLLTKLGVGPETARTVVDLIVASEPRQAGIDPYNKLIDRTPEDNVIAVKRRR